jgi:ATPase subunit of ABC transporter with duplicated ATPase domains
MAAMHCISWLLPVCRYFPGPYDAYVEAKAAAALAGSRQAAALDKQRKHMEASIAAAEKQARQVRGLGQP